MLELERWIRQIPLFEKGPVDQSRIASAKVAVVGAGGLGSPVLLYLAAAGVRHFFIADSEQVEISNLNRQVLFTEEDIGERKVVAAKRRLTALDRSVEVVACDKRVEESAKEVKLFKPQVVVDCTDSLETRRFLNRLCISLSVPFVTAMVEGLKGMNACIYPKESACFECTFGGKASKNKVPPVLGVTAGIAGMIEAACCLKIIVGEKPLFNEVLRFDLNEFAFEKIKTSRRSGCPACGSQGNAQRQRRKGSGSQKS